jgi:hypothetical protein
VRVECSGYPSTGTSGVKREESEDIVRLWGSRREVYRWMQGTTRGRMQWALYLRVWWCI